MSGQVIEIRQPDPKAIREFADKIEGMVKEGAVIRSTIIVCAHDDDFFVLCHTGERVSGTIGILEIAKRAVLDDSWGLNDGDY